MARKIGSHSKITGPKVREAALGLMAEHGYAAVSMRQIAAEVGVQAGALYNYTPDKQSLLYDLMHDHLTEVLALLEDEPVTAGPALARLDALTLFHIRHHAPRTKLVFLSYMELRNLTDENFARIEKLRAAYEAVIERILVAGNAEGSMQVPDTRIATMTLIAMLNGFCNWYRPGGRLSLDEIGAIYVRMVRGAVGAAA